MKKAASHKHGLLKHGKKTPFPAHEGTAHAGHRLHVSGGKGARSPDLKTPKEGPAIARGMHPPLKKKSKTARGKK